MLQEREERIAGERRTRMMATRESWSSRKVVSDQDALEGSRRSIWTSWPYPQPGESRCDDNKSKQFAPCDCQIRHQVPPHPRSLLFPPTEENAPKLKDSLLNHYSSSTFNNCTHQTLPIWSTPQTCNKAGCDPPMPYKTLQSLTSLEAGGRSTPPEGPEHVYHGTSSTEYPSPLLPQSGGPNKALLSQAPDSRGPVWAERS